MLKIVKPFFDLIVSAGIKRDVDKGDSMNMRKALVAALVTVATVVAVVFAVRDGQIVDRPLWFSTGWLLLLAMPFAGLLAAGFSRRKNPRIEGDKILRHDDVAILEHWTHGIGTFILLVTGIALGFFFIPCLLNTGGVHASMNVHYVGALLFLFGTFYYLGNALYDVRRVSEHLPDKNLIRYSIAHYGTLLGLRKGELPPEGKYFESERAAYIIAVVGVISVVVSGIAKGLAYVLVLPGAFMGAMTLVHNISAAVLLLFFVAHVFFAAIAPGTFPLLKSMITGYIPVEHVKKEHGGWHEELLAQEGASASFGTASDVKTAPAGKKMVENYNG